MMTVYKKQSRPSPVVRCPRFTGHGIRTTEYEIQDPSRRGSILITALWALGFLSFFCVSLGAQIQQGIILLSRMNKRAVVRSAAEAGIFKAMAILKSEYAKNPLPGLARDSVVFNSPAQFENIELGDGRFDVSYVSYDEPSDKPLVRYGLSDEERRLNINRADRAALKRLITEVTSLDDESAGELAGGIIDWREYGASNIEGFHSDDFYENLEFPYQEKKGAYETLDELLLVRGMDEIIYAELIDFVTIYGNGLVNINTAPRVVLMAVGLTEEEARTLAVMRRGADGLSGTPDDYFFLDANTAVLRLAETLDLEPPEIERLHALVAQGTFTTVSAYYRAQSKGALLSGRENNIITCVFQGNDGKIQYWREQ